MKKVIATAIVVGMVITGGYFLSKSANQTSKPIDQQTNALQESITTVTPPTAPEANIEINNEVKAEIKNEVIYTDTGFLPSELKIKIGDTVMFKNESSSGMWVGSAMHPSHMVYSGIPLGQHCPDTTNSSFDECASAQPKESWSFTFNKQGTWGYHNHVKSMHFGKIIVESSP